MGSWYSTCFMSHLPLMPGDDVAIFILAPNHPEEKDGLTCYPTDRYTPIGFPIFAEYDDDVQVRNIREINDYLYRYLHEFTTVYTKTYAKDDYGHDNPNFEEYNWTDMKEFVLDTIHGELYVNGRNGDKQRLEHAMVHTDLYKRLIQNIANRVPYGQKKTLEDLVSRKILKTIEWLREDDELVTEMKLKHGIDVPSFRRFSDKLSIDHYLRWNILDKMAKYYLETEDVYILDHILNYILWSHVMNYSRYGYCCISGAGSQCQEMMLQKIIAEFIIVKCTEREMEAEEDYEKDYEGNALEETLFWYDKD